MFDPDFLYYLAIQFQSIPWTRSMPTDELPHAFADALRSEDASGEKACGSSLLKWQKGVDAKSHALAALIELIQPPREDILPFLQWEYQARPQTLIGESIVFKMSELPRNIVDFYAELKDEYPSLEQFVVIVSTESNELYCLANEVF